MQFNHSIRQSNSTAIHSAFNSPSQSLPFKQFTRQIDVLYREDTYLSTIGNEDVENISLDVSISRVIKGLDVIFDS